MIRCGGNRFFFPLLCMCACVYVLYSVFLILPMGTCYELYICIMAVLSSREDFDAVGLRYYSHTNGF